MSALVAWSAPRKHHSPILVLRMMPALGPRSTPCKHHSPILVLRLMPALVPRSTPHKHHSPILVLRLMSALVARSTPRKHHSAILVLRLMQAPVPRSIPRKHHSPILVLRLISALVPRSTPRKHHSQILVYSCVSHQTLLTPNKIQPQSWPKHGTELTLTGHRVDSNRALTGPCNDRHYAGTVTSPSRSDPTHGRLWHNWRALCTSHTACSTISVTKHHQPALLAPMDVIVMKKYPNHPHHIHYAGDQKDR